MANSSNIKKEEMQVPCTKQGHQEKREYYKYLVKSKGTKKGESNVGT
jgi:hypothetical protein